MRRIGEFIIICQCHYDSGQFASYVNQHLEVTGATTKPQLKCTGDLFHYLSKTIRWQRHVAPSDLSKPRGQRGGEALCLLQYNNLPHAQFISRLCFYDFSLSQQEAQVCL